MKMMRAVGLGVFLGGSCAGVANPLLDMFLDWDPAWPQRFGVSAVGYLQEQEYSIVKADIMLGALAVPKAAIGTVENDVTQLGVKADVWILPFWNVHGLIGNVDATTNVTPAVPLFDPVEVKYEGTVYGLGTTLAYGQDWWFTSVTGTITQTELDTGSNNVEAWLFPSPR